MRVGGWCGGGGSGGVARMMSGMCVEHMGHLLPDVPHECPVFSGATHSALLHSNSRMRAQPLGSVIEVLMEAMVSEMGMFGICTM